MSVDWLELGGTVCVVTGAGGGIGCAISESLARLGAKVVAIDRDAGAAERTASAIIAEGGAAVAIAADIADLDSVEVARARAEQVFGSCQVLVNNAAVVRNAPMADLSLSDWNTVIGVNLTGYFICSQVFGRGMRSAGKGSVVHIASIAGSLPQPTSGAYSVSKAGLMMLSKNLALEWGQDGVRSNVVSPAMVLTPLSEVIYRDPEVKAKRESIVPVRRIGAPQDIANAVCFLASDRASYVSGQEILVDGGWSAAMLAMIPRPGFDQPYKE